MFRRNASEMRVVILAPVGRDAQLLAGTLTALKIESEIAEEALRASDIKQLEAWIIRQPPWSDLPVIILTLKGRPTAQDTRRAQELQALGNVTLIERPVRPETMQSALRAALRARGRQYEMRARQEDLLRANADLEQFAHSASHDLREPIRSISVYSELLKKHCGNVLDQTAAEFLAVIQSGAVRMEALLQDLLSYARASNISDQAPEPICANEPLKAALSNLAAAIQDSGAEVEVGEMPRVRILPTHLEQVFQNLIGNAIKYRKENPPFVRIAARQGGSAWVFSIEDNGIGIAAEYKESIFGLFTRLHTNYEYSGTGMGLAICQRIVERYGGRIWVESQLGRGSKFFFTIAS